MNYDRLKNDIYIYILQGTINRKNGPFRESAIYRVHEWTSRRFKDSRIFEIVALNGIDGRIRQRTRRIVDKMATKRRVVEA